MRRMSNGLAGAGEISGEFEFEFEFEVVAKATRRRATAEYKVKVLQEADACNKPGEIGALLRREGLYVSNLKA